MNSFGNLFRVTLSGESHGRGILAILEGIPAGLSLDSIDFATPLARRRRASIGTTSRQEVDAFEFLSGLYNGFTTGTPLSIFVPNVDTRSSDYHSFVDVPRPGHADFVAQCKSFSYSDPRGGGIHSGRLTVALVLAGTIARELLMRMQVSIEAVVEEVGGTSSWDVILQEAIKDGDSLGGVVSCTVRGVGIGYGSPFFDSLESLLSHALFSIPGVRAVAFGNGFLGCAMRGSEFNDALVACDGSTRTNHSGGVVGGVSNGNPIFFRVGFRPAASIAKQQHAYNVKECSEQVLAISGRHDSCFVLRCPVIVESVAALVLYDLVLCRKSELASHAML